MFRGSYPATLDAKGRLVLPARFRELLKAKGEEMLVLTYSLDRSILAYPLRQWELLEEKIGSLSDSDPAARDDYITYFFSLANECPIDNQGRILIPPKLRKCANIDKEVVLNGTRHKISIWNRQTWEEFEAEMKEEFEADEIKPRPKIRGVIHGLGF